MGAARARMGGTSGCSGGAVECAGALERNARPAAGEVKGGQGGSRSLASSSRPRTLALPRPLPRPDRPEAPRQRPPLPLPRSAARVTLTCTLHPHRAPLVREHALQRPRHAHPVSSLPPSLPPTLPPPLPHPRPRNAPLTPEPVHLQLRHLALVRPHPRPERHPRPEEPRPAEAVERPVEPPRRLHVPHVCLDVPHVHLCVPDLSRWRRRGAAPTSLTFPPPPPRPLADSPILLGQAVKAGNIGFNMNKGLIYLPRDLPTS